jgi:hypothetical protein
MSAVDNGGDDYDEDWEDVEISGMQQLPPGEEGFLQSHAGGKAMLQELMEGMSFSYVIKL